jgi:ribonuclease HI
LAFAHEIQLHGRTEKQVSIFSDSQVALKAARRTSTLVQQCQKAFKDTSTWHAVVLYWVPAHAGVQGNKTADKLARDSSVQSLVDMS